MALGARSPTTLARSPERRGEVRRRKRRRRRSEQRLSDARKILEERNAGLGPRHRDRLTLKRAAEEVGLTMRHPEQILSRHVRRRIAETTQNETPTPMGVHGAADVIEANPTNLDSDPTSALRRSGRVGNRAGNRSQSWKSRARKSSVCNGGVVEAESLWKNRCRNDAED